MIQQHIKDGTTMQITILGFNIFAKGGTSRSNINLIKAFLKNEHTVNYFNYKKFDQAQKDLLIQEEDLANNSVDIFYLNNLKQLAKTQLLIITREAFFKYSRLIKKYNPNIKIVGEIHGPLKYITEDIDLSLDTIDCVRVSTKSIKSDFIKRFNYKNVFNQYVNTEHIPIDKITKNTHKHFLIKSRFEDEVKDISYAIKLFNYIIKNKNTINIRLNIIGYGPSETLYKNLVNYYNLSKYVYINGYQPQNYIYISTSPYETLGYSIIESIFKGNRALIYGGDDGLLKEIYQSYHCTEFLTKDIEKDSEILLAFAQKNYNDKERIEDCEMLQEKFNYKNYAETYLKNIDIAINSKEVRFNSNYKLAVARKSKLKKDKNEVTLKERARQCYQCIRKVFHVIHRPFYLRKLNKIKPSKKYVFIECFHGKSFSGDPKYIAHAIRRLYPEKEIFVSSVNALVDMEIRENGFIPTRISSDDYVNKFRRSKYIFINGNAIDKVYKHRNQAFVETWHGLPMKKMVNDLNNKKERMIQLKNFLPRMKKWDYLLVSSDLNKKLFESAFQTSKNPKLNILNYGAPRNTYLLKNNTLEEQNRIKLKYLFKLSDKKKYILYCPTWRRNERETITNIDIEKLIDYLPTEYDIIIKLHPNEGALRKCYSHINERLHCFFNELVDIQELYLISECIITDYSSTIFDYAHLNKPIILLQEDEELYQKETGYYFNIFDYGSFTIGSKNEELLAQQIVEHESVDYSRLINLLMTNDSTDSCEKILKEIFEI